MANPQNLMKLMQALGAGGPAASADYSQGTAGPSNGFGGDGMQNGQPALPKPAISQPDLMSPYAPGNTEGGYHQQKDRRAHTDDNMKPTKMGDSDNHPAAQLAKYLVNDQGVTQKVLGQVNSAAYLRGGARVGP